MDCVYIDDIVLTVIVVNMFVIAMKLKGDLDYRIVVMILICSNIDRMFGGV